MRIRSLLFGALGFLAAARAAEVVLMDDEVVVEDELAAEIPIDGAVPANEPAGFFVSAVFPEDNPFGHVTNGEKNRMIIILENKTPHNVTLVSVTGQFVHAESDTLIKNISALSYGVPMFPGSKLQLPYAFHSELKPGDTRLRLYADHLSEDGITRDLVYDSIVTIVEPEISIFDFKLISTYLLVSALLAGLGYAAFRTFVPQQKKKRTAQVSAPVGPVVATGAGGYQEEWIPEHHLKKTRKGTNGPASGGETSGTEGTGAETRKRRNARK